MKYLSILTVLFLLAYQGKDQDQPTKLDAAYSYINANSGDGTDCDINDAVGKAIRIYDLDSAETETILKDFYL